MKLSLTCKLLINKNTDNSRHKYQIFKACQLNLHSLGKLSVPKSCSIMQIFDTVLPNSVPLRTTVARYLFLLQWELIIVCEFFTSRNMTFCVYEDLFLTLNTYDLCVAIRLKSTEQNAVIFRVTASHKIFHATYL